jgi:membrane associated rhomboid family serine protease
MGEISARSPGPIPHFIEQHFVSWRLEPLCREHGLLLIYFLSGVLATLAQVFFSPVGYLLGSSGAISGVTGAVFVLYPMKMPEGLFRRYFPWISRIPVFVYVGLWFVWNLRMGIESILHPAAFSSNGQVAYWAHVGGFAAGAVMALPWILSNLGAGKSADEI